MADRPILKNRTGPQVDADPVVPTGGDYLGTVIFWVDLLRIKLGYPNWAALAPLCDDDPRTTDRAGLIELGNKLQKMVNERQH